jgi:hypothetical protein
VRSGDTTVSPIRIAGSQRLTEAPRARFASSGVERESPATRPTLRLSKAEFIERADKLRSGFRAKTDQRTVEPERTPDRNRQAEIVRELADEAEVSGEEFKQVSSRPVMRRSSSARAASSVPPPRRIGTERSRGASARSSGS